MVEIYLIRHGESEANKKHLFGTNLPLSFKGHSQCIEARKIYRNIPFDRIYSSELLRASQTAAFLFQKPPVQISEFNEIWFGKVEGMGDTKSGIEGFFNQYDDDFVAFMEECEGDDPYERAEACIGIINQWIRNMIVAPSAHSRIVVVTSDTLMRCIVLTLKRGRDWRRVSDLPYVHNLSHTKLIYTKNGILSSIIMNGEKI